MISRVQIANFRALKRVDVSLKPLTVLIGPNDSGKSSFLDAILLQLWGERPRREDWWRLSSSLPPEIVLSEENGMRADSPARLFRLPAAGVAMTSPGVGPGVPRLEEDGGNLATVLDYMLRKERRRFDAIQAELCGRVPGVLELRIETADGQGSSRSIAAAIDGAVEVPGASLSTGVRLLLFFLTLVHHPEPPQVVLLEEPENGVHPGRLAEIMGLLRHLVAGELGGRPTQVILSTHSPYLLDHVRLPEDQVLVFRREADGNRSVTQVDENRLRGFLDEFMLGEVWFNRGEEGLVAQTK